MGSCDKCTAEQKVFLPYGPHRFCKEHFLEFFENRVRKTTRAHKMVKAGEKIAVGLSGGKDSSTTLLMLSKIFSKTNELKAVMIDEGISGYRDKALEKGKELCKKLGVPFTVARYKKEFGYSMEEIKEKIDQNAKLGSACSFCGAFRKHLLNKLALEVGATKLATGHNLDDEVQSVAMNFFEASLQKMARHNTATQKQSGFFVQRIKPLMLTPEKEIIAFCAFKNLEHYSDECCPFSFQAKRNYFREMLNNLEASVPGTKFSVMRSFEQLQPLLAREKMLSWKKCLSCGAPASSRLCTVCAKLKQLKESKKGLAKKEKEKRLSCALKYV